MRTHDGNHGNATKQIEIQHEKKRNARQCCSRRRLRRGMRWRQNPARANKTQRNTFARCPKCSPWAGLAMWAKIGRRQGTKGKPERGAPNVTHTVTSRIVVAEMIQIVTYSEPSQKLPNWVPKSDAPNVTENVIFAIRRYRNNIAALGAEAFFNNTQHGTHMCTLKHVEIH